jgi:hypothetical protein
MLTTATNQTISWFNKRNEEKSLTLAPPFQRKPVWTEKQKSLLIDTILRELPIPEIYIQRKTTAEGETEYIVVDGQQRIRSILEFINGDFSIIEEEDEEPPPWAGFEFSELIDDLKKRFWGFNLAVRELPDLTDEEVRDIFRRLNVNLVPLNKQELRNARYNGPFIKLMTTLADNEYWAENRIVTATEIRRMKDIEFVSELFVAMMHGIQQGKSMLDIYYRQYEIEFPEERYWKTLFSKALNTIEEILPELWKSRWKKKPDFYGLFLAFSNGLEKYLISSEDYEKIEKKLIKFGKEVDKAIAVTDKSKFSKDIKDYCFSVERATGNKERRVMREEVISNLFEPFFKEKRIRRRRPIEL